MSVKGKKIGEIHPLPPFFIISGTQNTKHPPVLLALPSDQTTLPLNKKARRHFLPQYNYQMIDKYDCFGLYESALDKLANAGQVLE